MMVRRDGPWGCVVRGVWLSVMVRAGVLVSVVGAG